MAAGDFSASYLPDVLVRQEQIWADSRANRDLQEPVTALKGVLERQAVTFDPIVMGDQCVGYKAAWLKASVSVTDNSDGESDLDACDMQGTEIESDNATYAPNISLRTGPILVKDDECKDLFDMQEKIARAMLTAKTELKKSLTQTLLTWLNANASASDYTIAYGAIHHTLNGVVQEIDPTEWTSDILAEFNLHAQYHKLNNPYILTGRNLYKDFWLTPFRTDFGNDAAQGVYTQGPYDLIFDPRNIDVFNSVDRTYFIDAGALGFFVKNYNSSTTPEQITADRFRYQEPDMDVSLRNGNSMIPLTYDIYMQRGCYIKNGTARVPGWTFEVQLNGGLHAAPADENGKNGILIFDNVAEATS